MSGQPLRTPLDADKFRQQYLNELALRAQLDQKNLDANKIYLKTGVTPTQMTDTRTTAEKYADIERLKIQVRSELSSIMDGINADNVVNSITNDELTFLANNIQPITQDIKQRYKLGIQAAEFTVFLRNYMAKYALTRGVELGLQQTTGNDILLTGQDILNDMVTKQDLDALMKHLDSIFQRVNISPNLQQSLRQNITLAANSIPDAKTLSAFSSMTNSEDQFEAMTALNDAMEYYPTTDQLAVMIKDLETAERANDGRQIHDILVEVNSAMSQSPSAYMALQQAQESILESHNMKSLGLSMGDIQTPADISRIGNRRESNITDLSRMSGYDMSPDIEWAQIEPPNFGQTPPALMPTNDDVARSIGQQEIEPEIKPLPTDKNTWGTPLFAAENNVPFVSSYEIFKKIRTNKELQYFLLLNRFVLRDSQNRKISPESVTMANIKNTNADEVVQRAFDYWKSIEGTPNTKLQLRRTHINPTSNVVSSRINKIPTVSNGPYRGRLRFSEENMDPTISTMEDYKKLSVLKKREFLTKNEFILSQQDNNNIYASQITNHHSLTLTNAPVLLELAFKYWDGNKKPSGGTGFEKRRRKIKGNGLPIDTELGVEQIKYVPFGRYVLNKHHLFQNKVSLKTPYGKSVPNFPAKLVSEDLTNVLNTIVGKGVPSFDDLNKLSEEEKQFLHKLASVSQISDRLSIPTPNKNEEQKDVNRFLILKGEIMAGNDSSQLIKEFKLLIIRLKSNGVLPKKEATDLLIELANLGY